MKYNNIYKAIFIDRPNRFIAHVQLNGNIETVHVKNTGRCKELLINGCTVYIEKSDNPFRKTAYDLITVEKNISGKSTVMINIDSQAPNTVVEEWLKKGNLFSKNADIVREKKYGDSRFDFYIKDQEIETYLEVKGVTLEENSIAFFPDAPTERGVKHINELIRCRSNGLEAYLMFVIQMKGVHQLRPNDLTHPEFGNALRKAAKAGVKLITYDCIVTEDSIEIDEEIPLITQN